MQFDIFDTEEQRKLKIKKHDENQLSFLPVNPLQEKFGQDEPTLTPCEYEVMHMVLSGYSIQEIGMKVFIGKDGVKYRLTNIYWKFGVHNRLELIKKSAIKALHFKIEEYDKKTKQTYITKHTFHNNVNLRAHEKVVENENS
jgi:DNA-binding CsgD family transcriptional regulator